MKIGDIDVQNEILSLHLQMGIIDRALEYIQKNNPQINFPPESEWIRFRAEALKNLQMRFPVNNVQG